MSEPKTVSRDTYLKALAMFTMGNQLYVQARDLQLRIGDMFGLEDGSHVDDAFYSNTIASVRDFDAALKRQDITVEPETAPLPNGER